MQRANEPQKYPVSLYFLVFLEHLEGQVILMVEIPGNDISIRNKIAQQKIKTKEGGSKPSQQSTGAPANPGASRASEQIVLSIKAKNIQKAQETAKSSPDIRTEKVSRIKKEIADGTFKVESDVLARKILEDIIKESNFLS